MQILRDMQDDETKPSSTIISYLLRYTVYFSPFLRLFLYTILVVSNMMHNMIMLIKKENHSTFVYMINYESPYGFSFLKKKIIHNNCINSNQNKSNRAVIRCHKQLTRKWEEYSNIREISFNTIQKSILYSEQK